MYGLPKDQDWTFLQGLEVSQITVDQWNLLISFYPKGSINMQCGWTLLDSNGTEIDRSKEHGSRDSYRIHRIISKRISAVEAEEKTLYLKFDDGHLLTISDDSEQYESFNIQHGETSIYV